MTPSQCRAARGLLKWTQEQLASAAEVHGHTVHGFENEETLPRRASLKVMQQAFDKAGVIFIKETGEAGPGVRLKKNLGITSL
jgi:DNA-binding XRE family transcriptional regulator